MIEEFVSFDSSYVVEISLYCVSKKSFVKTNPAASRSVASVATMNSSVNLF